MRLGLGWFRNMSACRAAFHMGLRARARSIVQSGAEGCYQLRLILVEDLRAVTVSACVRQSEYIGARRQGPWTDFQRLLQLYEHLG